MSRVFASLLLVAFSHAPASAAAPSAPIFDPAALKLQKGQPTEVLVLGTPHLSQLPKSFDPANLSVLNERLAAWRPDAIAIEALSGMQCTYLRSYPQRYADAIKSYCWDPAAAQAATGLDVAAATVQAERVLAAALTLAWDNPCTALRERESVALNGQLQTPAGVLALYRAYNDRAAAGVVFRSDFGAALEELSPQLFCRSYVAYWEVRNLRMASNIRKVMMARPGMRILVLVGASHKAYLEACLNQMRDVHIANADAILRQND